MSSRLRLVSFVVFVAALTLWALYALLIPTPGPISKALGAAVDGGKGQPIEIAKVTRFRWDEMFIMHGYQGATEDMKRQWCEHHSFSPEQCSEVEFAPVGDAWQMLMFRDQGKIARSELHMRMKGDLLPARQPLSPSDAVFEVMLSRDLVAGKPWPYLVQRGGSRPAESVPVAEARDRR